MDVSLDFTSAYPRYSFTIADMEVIHSYIEAMHGVTKGPQYIRLAARACARIRWCIDRYGDDGYGDKPETMTPVEYWIQHS